MTSRELLIALHKKHEGNWEKIMEDIQNRRIDYDFNALLKDVDTTKFVTLLDDEYPFSLRNTIRPPFVLDKTKAKDKKLLERLSTHSKQRPIQRN